MQQQRQRRHLSSFQIIVTGFVVLIAGGSALLMLPVATLDGHGAPLADALFTATSATCVTGLIVHDTASYWSVFGQVVIIVLIQTGGIGVLTVAVAVYSLVGKRVSLRQRCALREALAAPSMEGVTRLVGFIIKIALAVEAIGTLIMLPAFVGEFGLGQGIWYAVFHSISAFCNAGFDLMGIQAPYSSLTSFVSNPAVSLTVSALIVIGGIGFLTWSDVRACGLRVHRYRMQTKVILVTTALLVFVPALYFFVYEFGGMPIGERILASLFQSITPRTAGFNTVDLQTISTTGLALMVVLMLVGGSTGSTAGGIKVTTLAVLLGTTGAVFCRKEHTSFFGRRIAHDTVRTALAVFISYLALFLIGGLVISHLENLSLLACLYETASAIGTVGLSLGITPELGAGSRAILIALMFLGRVGSVTLAFAAWSNASGSTAKLPQEKMTVG